MKKVSIISACTDLGLKIDGAELGAQVLTNDLKSSNISHNYVLKGNKKMKNLTQVQILMTLTALYQSLMICY